MYDDDGKAYQRRDCDAWLKIAVPVLVSSAVAVAGWIMSVEVRLNSISTIQTERTIKITAMQAEIDMAMKAATDPAPKPETRVAVDDMKADHHRMDERIDRLEERLTNMHNFFLNAPPSVLQKLRRGEIPLIEMESKG